jgi:hypothetical protein
MAARLPRGPLPVALVEPRTAYWGSQSELGSVGQAASLQKVDRGDLNSRPSEPQSVAAFPSLFWRVSLCGLFRPKTRSSLTAVAGASRAVLDSIAATLLPLPASCGKPAVTEQDGLEW